jgi:hypothetical protein
VSVCRCVCERERDRERERVAGSSFADNKDRRTNFSIREHILVSENTF